MTLAAVARLSRRHLPVVATRAHGGGARTVASVQEAGRLPSPAPRHHLGRLQPCHPRQLGGALPPSPLRHHLGRLQPCYPRQLGGALPPAPLRQSQRSLSSSGKISSDIDHICVGKEFVRLVRELEEISASLDRDLNLFKNTLVLVFGVALASIVSFPVQISTMGMDMADVNTKMKKRHLESVRVMKEADKERSQAIELQKRVAEELAKRSASDA